MKILHSSQCVKVKCRWKLRTFTRSLHSSASIIVTVVKGRFKKREMKNNALRASVLFIFTHCYRQSMNISTKYVFFIFSVENISVYFFYIQFFCVLPYFRQLEWNVSVFEFKNLRNLWNIWQHIFMFLLYFLLVWRWAFSQFIHRHRNYSYFLMILCDMQSFSPLSAPIRETT